MLTNECMHYARNQFFFSSYLTSNRNKRKITNFVVAVVVALARLSTLIMQIKPEKKKKKKYIEYV